MLTGGPLARITRTAPILTLLFLSIIEFTHSPKGCNLLDYAIVRPFPLNAGGLAATVLAVTPRIAPGMCQPRS